MKVYFLLPLLFCYFSGTTQNSSTRRKLLDRENYKIQYPNTWDLDTTGMMGTDILVFSPVENGVDQFRENINIII